MMNDKLPQEEIDSIFSELKKSAWNNRCMDCQSRNPKWASVSLGLFLCMDCAGQHRNLGVQYTFARSLNLDTWTRKQITYMLKGGNERAFNYFKKNGLEIKSITDYTSAISLRYKEDLNKIVEKEFSSTINEQQQQIISPSKQQQPKQQPQQQQQQSQVKPKENTFQNNLKTTSTTAPSQLPLSQINKPKMGSYNQPKGKVAGKKLAGDFDFNTLSIADKEKSVTPSDCLPSQEKKTIRKTSSSLELNQENNNSNIKSLSSKNYNNYYNQQEETKDQYNKFNGYSSLSSRQLFGQEAESSNNYSNQEGQGLAQYIQLDSIFDYASTNIQRLKESAGNAVERIKQWKNQA